MNDCEGKKRLSRKRGKIIGRISISLPYVSPPKKPVESEESKTLWGGAWVGKDKQLACDPQETGELPDAPDM